MAEGRPILVAVDFSAHSEEAVRWAIDQARLIAVPLVVLHVAHDRPEDPGYYVDAQMETDPKDGSTLRSIEEAASLMLDRFLGRMAQQHPRLMELAVQRMVVVGVATQRILELAETLDAVLIVMGSHGRTGLSRTLLGSKTEEVVRLSPRPVVVVKAAVAATAGGRES